MRYIVVTVLVLASFVGGVYYENHRLVGEPDTTIAVMISKQAIENSSFQLNKNSQYLALINEKEYVKLEQQIQENSELLSEIVRDMKSVCIEVKCSDEQRLYIEGIK